MKMRKIAKDKTGLVLQPGDIILLDGEESVITEMSEMSRTEFPKLQITKYVTDWRGKGLEEKKATLAIDQYRNCKILNVKNLRDDVPKNRKLKLISSEICGKMAFSRREN